MNTLQANFVRNLRRERKRIGLTQEAMAERVGVSPKYYGALELGYKFPSVDTLDSIVKALDVPASRLFVEREVKTGLSTEELLDEFSAFLGQRLVSGIDDAKKVFLDSLLNTDNRITP